VTSLSSTQWRPSYVNLANLVGTSTHKHNTYANLGLSGQGDIGGGGRGEASVHELSQSYVTWSERVRTTGPSRQVRRLSTHKWDWPKRPE